MGKGEDALDVLRSIDATLKAMLALAQKRTQANQPKSVAPDRDLDGKYGDPELRFMPRDWSGATYKGCRFSECPPDLLDLVAESCEWFASQSDAKGEVSDKGKPLGDYKRMDAARARGWAKRMREGKHKPPLVSHGGGGQADDFGNASEWNSSDGF